MRVVDTNMLIYAISRMPEDAEKGMVAQELLDSGDLALSAQVLQEFYVQATRPSGPGELSHDQAVGFMDTLRRYPIQAITLDVVWTALAFRRRFGLSYWDGAILAAAKQSGCTSVLSEDMSADQDYEGLRVTNPFANTAQSR